MFLRPASSLKRRRCPAQVGRAAESHAARELRHGAAPFGTQWPGPLEFWPEAVEENGSACLPLASGGQVSWNFCFRGADGKRPGRACVHFAVVAPTLAILWPPAGVTSLFPAKREVKREVCKAWQAWPGNQTSSKCLVRSLVGAGGAWSGPGPQNQDPT